MMFKGMLGCLFILIFGGIFFIFGIFMFIYKTLFGKRKPQQGPWGANFGGTGGTQQQSYQQTHTESTAGDAHHEANRNSRQKRKEKIFEKNEGEYVDFEEV